MAGDDESRETYAALYPTIANWLAKAKQDQIWKRLLDTPRIDGVKGPTVADMMLRPLEEMASTVDRANPLRLPSLQRRFRDANTVNTLAVRLELACAAKLT